MFVSRRASASICYPVDMESRYMHLGLDEISGTCRRLYGKDDLTTGLLELLGMRLRAHGWPGDVVRHYFDLAFHDGMATHSFLALDGRKMDLSGDNEDQALAGLIENGTTYRWGGTRSTQDGRGLTDVWPARPDQQKVLDDIIEHIDAALDLEANTPEGQSSRRLSGRI